MISVCMATYNGERFLKEQIDSILLQLGQEDELIISDDQSTDDTVRIIEEKNDLRIRLLRRTGRRGVVGNFGNAISASSGDSIFLSDQDDIWLPGKIETMVAHLVSSEVVVCDAQIVDQAGQIMHESLYNKKRIRGSGLVKNFMRNGYTGSCMAFRRSLISKCLPFPASIPMHDQWIGLMGELGGKTCFIQDKLMLVRLHQDNLSSSLRGERLPHGKQLKNRIVLLRAILSRSFMGA